MAKLQAEARDLYTPRNFVRMLNHVPQRTREQIADKYDYDYRARKVFFEPHLRAWVLFTWTQDETLRDMHAAVNGDPLYQLLGAGLDVSLGGLSEAHQKRPYAALVEVLEVALARIERLPTSQRILRELPPELLQQVGELLSQSLLFDSTTLRLPPRIKAWAEQHSEEALPLKVHLRLHGGYGGLDRIVVAPEHEHDQQQYRELLDLEHPVEDHAIYLHDCGYRELCVYDEVVAHGHDFVTRFHSQTSVQQVAERDLPAEKTLATGYTLIRDRIVTLGANDNQTSHDYRLINVKDSAGKPLVILTSLLDRPVETVCALYYYRWTIEILFRWLKHVLSLQHLVSHTPNGIMMHIVATLLAYALLVLYHQDGPLSLKQLCRELRFQMHAVLYQLGYQQGLRDARADPDLPALPIS